MGPRTHRERKFHNYVGFSHMNSYVPSVVKAADELMILSIKGSHETHDFVHPAQVHHVYYTNQNLTKTAHDLYGRVWSGGCSQVYIHVACLSCLIKDATVFRTTKPVLLSDMTCTMSHLLTEYEYCARSLPDIWNKLARRTLPPLLPFQSKFVLKHLILQLSATDKECCTFHV